MIELKDWKVVLGWDASKVKSGLKSLETMMRRVEKIESQRAKTSEAKKKAEENRAWTQHKKQQAAKNSAWDKAEKAKEKQENRASALRKREADNAIKQAGLVAATKVKSEARALQNISARNRKAASERIREEKRIEVAKRRSNDLDVKGITLKNTLAARSRKVTDGLESLERLKRKGLLEPAQYEGMKVRAASYISSQKGVTSGKDVALDKGNFERINHELQKAKQKARDLGRELNKAGFAANSLSHSIKNMAKSWLSIYALVEGVVGFYRIGTAFDSMNASMLAASGSAEQAGANMKFLIGTSQNLGLELQSAVTGYNKLGVATRAAGFSAEQTNEMFLGAAESATAFTLNSSQQSLIFLAMSQMASKARVSMEELQRQMGDNLPTAMEAMRRAYSDFSGKETSRGELIDLVSAGKVLSQDVMPLFAKHLRSMARDGGALEAAMKKVSTQQKRTMTQLQLNVKDSFADADGLFSMGWQELTESLRAAKPVFMLFGKVLGATFSAIAVTTRIISPLLGVVANAFENLFKLWKGFGKTATDALSKSAKELTLWDRVALTVTGGLYMLAAGFYYLIGALEWFNENTTINEDDNPAMKLGKGVASMVAAVFAAIAAWKVLSGVVRGFMRITGIQGALDFIKGGKAGQVVDTVGKAARNPLVQKGGSSLLKRLPVAGNLVSGALAGKEMYDFGSGEKNLDSQWMIENLAANIATPLLGLTSLFNNFVAQKAGESMRGATTIEVNNNFNGASTEDGRKAADAFAFSLKNHLIAGL